MARSGEGEGAVKQRGICGQNGQKIRVELAGMEALPRRCAVQQPMAGRLMRQRRFIGAFLAQGGIDVAERDQPRRRRDRLAAEAMRIARPIPALMVHERHFRRQGQSRLPRGSQYIMTILGMAPNERVFFRRKPPGLVEHGIGHHELADIVQLGGMAIGGAGGGGQAQMFRERERERAAAPLMREGLAQAEFREPP